MSSWMPREQWDALVRGETCPMCEEMQDNLTISTEGAPVAEMASGRWRLALNQYIPGYSLLLSRLHVTEWYHLSAEQSALFFDDLRRISLAIEQVYHPIKMNFEILGNAIRHLHCHIIPRYYGDAAPGTPINFGEQVVRLPEDDMRERVHILQQALDQL